MPPRGKLDSMTFAYYWGCHMLNRLLTNESLQKLPSKGLILTDQGVTIILRDRRMPTNTTLLESNCTILLQLDHTTDLEACCMQKLEANI